MKLLITLATLAGIATSTQGCAALVAGYLIGDGIQRSKASDNCHATIREINLARMQKNQEPFPDQCSN